MIPSHPLSIQAKHSTHTPPDPLIMSNGLDILEMVCNSYESPPEGEPGGGGSGSDDEDETEQFDFSGFRCAVLRQGPHIVSVATFR